MNTFNTVMTIVWLLSAGVRPNTCPWNLAVAYCGMKQFVEMNVE